MSLLLEHLRHGAMSCTELAERTGWTDHRVQAALDRLVDTGLVRRWPRGSGPAEYELTVAGLVRLPPDPATVVLTDADRPGWPRYRQLGQVLALMLLAAGCLVYWRAGLFLWSVFAVVVGGQSLLAYREWRRKP